jgi:hypothetical protein
MPKRVQTPTQAVRKTACACVPAPVGVSPSTADSPGPSGDLFSAHVEDSRMMRVELISLRCDGERADVEVV